MNPSNKLLSDIVAFRSYAKYLPHLQRRESMEETINRCMTMHLDKFPKLSKDIIKAFGKVHDYEVMPSMRGLQFGNSGIDTNNIRQYNCSYTVADNPRMFGEVFFILLSGAGVGFSVVKEQVNRLPVIKKPKEEGVFKVHDSIEGWAQTIDLLMDAYFYNRVRPIFDFSAIRPKGTRLGSTGAKAPGPEPLKAMLTTVEHKLKEAIGRKLRPIEVHDIICIISEAVLAGGLRRSSLISLFSKDDTEMLNAKKGEWWVSHPWRARANNSVMLHRDTTTKEEFDFIYSITQQSGSGEPGFFWTSDSSNYMGCNPCGEVALNPNQMCNLTSVNQTGISTKNELLSRVYSATLIGTLQASYTSFPYVRDIWRETTEKEALLGVSFTGIADSQNVIPAEWLEEAALYAVEVNEKYAKKIGINPAARITTVKPEGSCSAVVGSSSGIHARHSPYYLRRIRISKNDSLASYLNHTIPNLMEDDKFAANTVVVTIPQESPKRAIIRKEETALTLFDRILLYDNYWVTPGHRSGVNRNNVSATISVRPEEWEALREEMWNHRFEYTGVSLLPFDDHTYIQAPFEDCTKEEFEKLSSYISDKIDLRNVMENEDNTVRQEIVACSGGACEVV